MQEKLGFFLHRAKSVFNQHADQGCASPSMIFLFIIPRNHAHLLGKFAFSDCVHSSQKKSFRPLTWKDQR